MRNFLLLASLLFTCGLTVYGQSSLLVTNEATGLPVSNGGIIYRSTAVGIEDLLDINVKNTSGSTKAYKFRRFDDVLNSGADAYFCVQQCYTPATMISPTSLTLTSNQDAISIGVHPSFHLLENTAVGQSDIRYHIYDEADPSGDLFVLTVKYNNPASVKQAANSYFSVSETFPNPSSSKSFINITAQEATNGLKLSIMNSLGAVVSFKLVDLTPGKNTITIDTENLSSGIYIVNIGNGQSRIVRKMTISK